MTDGHAGEFPLKKVPDPDDADPEYLAAVTEQMRRTRKAVAPNPLAQALYPTLPPA
jgi:hypothetical protein